MSANWIFKNGLQSTDCMSFPYAFRTMHSTLTKARESGKFNLDLIKEMSILGPKNLKGERTKYSYTKAAEMAQAQGLLTSEGNINNREFKKK